MRFGSPPVLPAGAGVGSSGAMVTRPADDGADASRHRWSSIDLRRVVDPADAELHVAPTPHLTLVMVTSGSYVIESRRSHGWERGLLWPGRFAVTAADRPVEARWSTTHSYPLHSLHVSIGPELLHEVTASGTRAGVSDRLAADDAAVRRLVLLLRRAADVRAPSLEAETLGLRLLDALTGGREEPPAVGRGLTVPQLRTVIDVLLSDLSDAVTLDTLARSVYLSRYHFLRRFAATTGETPMRFLTRMRMEHAERLLRTTDVPVGDIATASGYASLPAFSSAFRRLRGLSPRHFRRQRGDGGDDCAI